MSNKQKAVKAAFEFMKKAGGAVSIEMKVGVEKLSFKIEADDVESISDEAAILKDEAAEGRVKFILYKDAEIIDVYFDPEKLN